ncbi:MAG: hypothetical protein ACK4P8_05060 [Tabrizicola sp.]
MLWRGTFKQALPSPWAAFWFVALSELASGAVLIRLRKETQPPFARG